MLREFQRDDSAAAKLGKLEQGLQTYRLLLENVVPLLAALLAVRSCPSPLRIMFRDSVVENGDMKK